MASDKRLQQSFAVKFDIKPSGPPYFFRNLQRGLCDYKIQRRIHNLVKYLRWSFLQKTSF